MIPITQQLAVRRLPTSTSLVLLSLSSVFWGFCAVAETATTEPTKVTQVQSPAEVNAAAADAKALEERWGVEILAVRRAAAGHMLDFRYRVLDAGKAAPLFVRQTKPYLIHQKSGKALGVPETAKLGPLRNSNTPQAGRVYWMFFGNPGGFVQAGDRVTVAIGNFRFADLLVE